MISHMKMNAHIAVKDLRGEYMVELYTLPTCGICHTIKTKLEQKGIQFEEKDFGIVAESMGLDRAPVLHISTDDGEEYIMSPSKMNQWISRQ